MYLDGDFLTQAQFTDVILSLNVSEVTNLTLVTMSYDIPAIDCPALKVHKKLLALADAGQHIELLIDNTYGNRIEPAIDIPSAVARYIGYRNHIERRAQVYAELRKHNVHLAFTGSEKPPLFPLSKIDHRKILYVERNASPWFGIVYGFNINYLLGSDVADSAFYVTDQGALAWLRASIASDHYVIPSMAHFPHYTFFSRELTNCGNSLADVEIIRIIDSATKELIFSGQWLPDGIILRHLLDATKRGVAIDIYTNLPRLGQQLPYALFHLLLARRITHQNTGINVYVPSNLNGFFHIKGLLADYSTGNGSAITGTDNMTNRLLHRWGLREILIRLDDQMLVGKFYKWFREQVIVKASKFNFEETGVKNILRALNKKGAKSNQDRN